MQISNLSDVHWTAVGAVGSEILALTWLGQFFTQFGKCPLIWTDGRNPIL